MNINLAEITDYLVDLMPGAGHVLRRYFRNDKLSRKSKGKIDFATAADLSTDEFIRKSLKQNYPQIPILSEETFTGSFDRYKKLDLLWIVDPLDGTANFVRGDTNFSISIALVSRSQTIAGALFVPVNNWLYTARADSKFGRVNGRKIFVSGISDLIDSVVCTDWSHILSTRDLTTEFLRKIYGHVCQIKILGSAATNIVQLASGSIDIYHHVRLMPWDSAASAFIAAKAGAEVTDIRGEDWDVFTPSVLIANKSLHAKILNLIRE